MNYILLGAPLLPSVYTAFWLALEQRQILPDIMFYMVMAIAGYFMCDKLIPVVKIYLLKKGISGKDLGKKGTSVEDKDIPEACVIVPGSIFLIYLILCLVKFAREH